MWQKQFGNVQITKKISSYPYFVMMCLGYWFGSG